MKKMVRLKTPFLLQKLETLFIHHILYISCVAEIVAEEIDKCENLVYLDLDGNTIGIEAAKRISESLSKHGEFKRAIWKNMFTGRTKAEIPPALVRRYLVADEFMFLGYIQRVS